MKRKILHIFVISLLITGFFRPESVLADSFRVYLEYNQNTDRLDLRTSSGDNGYEVVDASEPFPEYPEDSRYSIHLYENQTEMIRYPYQPERSGALIVDVPYISTTNRIVIEKDQFEIIEIDVSSTISCNRNGICEAAAGESLVTCVPDCDGDNVVYDQEGERLTAQNPLVTDDSQRLLYQTPVPESPQEESTESGNGIFDWRLMIGGTFVLGGIGFVVFRMIKKFT